MFIFSYPMQCLSFCKGMFAYAIVVKFVPSNHLKRPLKARSISLSSCAGKSKCGQCKLQCCIIMIYAVINALITFLVVLISEPLLIVVNSMCLLCRM